MMFLQIGAEWVTEVSGNWTSVSLWQIMKRCDMLLDPQMKGNVK